jgi:putative ATPase
MSFAYKYRPTSFDTMVGQSHLVGKDGIIRKMVEASSLTHSFFYGEAGCGKTTLSRIIAEKLKMPFYELNATSFKLEEFREITKRHKNTLQKPLIFIDEVHRLSKNQQEVLLPYMEDMHILIIGASTQNPYYSLTSAMRSRSHLFELYPIEFDDMQKLLERVCKAEHITIDKESQEYLIHSSGGDARAMLNLLHSSFAIQNPITLKTLKSIRPNAIKSGTSESNEHYDVTSAMIKSIRGSDIDATLYYLARLIDGGESADFIARRLAILASEDIGNANPNALNLASSTLNIVQHIGFPEARIPLSQLAIYLASSPKSNSSYEAINKALQYTKNNPALDIPPNIKTHSKSYLYPHNFGGYVEQKHLNKPLKFYKSKNIGFEKTLSEWVGKIKGQ